MLGLALSLEPPPSPFVCILLLSQGLHNFAQTGLKLTISLQSSQD
jgi:hypothetical protein